MLFIALSTRDNVQATSDIRMEKESQARLSQRSDHCQFKPHLLLLGLARNFSRFEHLAFNAIGETVNASSRRSVSMPAGRSTGFARVTVLGEAAKNERPCILSLTSDQKNGLKKNQQLWSSFLEEALKQLLENFQITLFLQLFQKQFVYKITKLYYIKYFI